MGTFETTNGHAPEGADVLREKLAALGRLGDLPEREAFEQFRLLGEDSSPPHNIKRHPEDPVGAHAAMAREVCDPELIRVYAVHTGKASQAIDPGTFDRLLRRAYRGIARVRAGAILGPARAAAGEELKISATTATDAKRIVADRAADGLRADRLEAYWVPRGELKVRDAKQQREEAEANLAEADALVADVRPAGINPTEPRGGLMEWVRLPPKIALGVGILDIGVTTVVLQPAIAELIPTSELGSYLIAAGISSATILASGAAGFALAALRLSGKVIAAFMLVLFGAIMYKLVGGLDALRAGLDEGVETLTAATLACCFVALLTGYATAAWQDFKRRRELIEAAGSTLGDALAAREQARQALEQAVQDEQTARAELEALHGQIEDLRDSATRADAAALAREAQGTSAEVEIARIDAVARTGVAQEIAANEDWAVSAARFEYERTRAEELPHGERVQAPMLVGVPAATTQRGLTTLQKIAIGALGAGAAGGLLLTPWAVPVGAGIAAILLVIRRRAGGASGPVEPGTVSGPPPIGSPADDTNPFYRRQPTRMVAKYRDGGGSVGERQ